MIKRFDQFCEGLVHTVDTQQAVRVLSKALIKIVGKYSGFPSARVDEQHIIMEVADMRSSITEEVLRQVVPLMNNLGYYFSNGYINNIPIGRAFFTGPPTMPVNFDMDTLVKNAMDLIDDDEDVQLLIIFEPKFQKSARHPSTLYHLTELRLLNRILRNGLVPRSGSKLSFHPDRIYLGEMGAIRMIFHRYAHYIKSAEEDLVLLKVDARGLSLYQDINIAEILTKGNNAFFTADNIPPSRLHVVGKYSGDNNKGQPQFLGKIKD